MPGAQGQRRPVSEAQRKLVWWAKKNPKAAAGRGIKPSFANEMTSNDKGGKLPAQVKDGKPAKSRRERWYGKDKGDED